MCQVLDDDELQRRVSPRSGFIYNDFSRSGKQSEENVASFGVPYPKAGKPNLRQVLRRDAGRSGYLALAAQR